MRGAFPPSSWERISARREGLKRDDRRHGGFVSGSVLRAALVRSGRLNGGRTPLLGITAFLRGTALRLELLEVELLALEGGQQRSYLLT